MSDYKRVLKHLNKEELASQKVELALIDDLRQIVKEEIGRASCRERV